MHILVVGAGIAGLTTSLELHRAGYEVTLIEKAPRVRGAGYMIDFWGPGYDVAERIGLLPALSKLHRPFERLVFVDPAGRARASLPYARLRRGLFGGRHFNFLRGDLEGALYAAIAGRVRILFECSPVELDPIGSAIRVRTTRGPAEIYDLVVGADGFHSRVRDLAFLAGEGSAVHMGAHTAAYVTSRRIPGVPRDAFVSFSEPGFTASAYPLDGDRSATFFLHRADGWLEDRSPAAARRELESTYRGRGWILDELLDALPDDGDVYFDDVGQIQSLRWSEGRVVLVGDAAGCVSLLGGQGASLAMFGGFTLAQELRHRGSAVGEALVAYEARVRPLVQRAQRAAFRNESWFLPRTRLGARMRDTLTRTAASRPVAWLVGKALGGTHAALD
jgi:2-polyprenyl-6-methoxyphenol hydroxylase-like FAD-dependent oxidoreductase